MRHYLGGERYHIAPLGLADDFQDAVDDADVLTFADAQRMALGHKQARHRPGKGKTVADAMAAYVAEVGTERAVTADRAERTAAQRILPTLGRIRLADLTTDHHRLAQRLGQGAAAADAARCPAEFQARPGD